MNKKGKMKLIKFIQEVVKREVKKGLEEQRTEIISEVVNLLETRTFNESGDGYETDDPVLQRVLEKNQQQNNKRDVVEETIQSTESRDTETIQEQIRSLQQQVSQMNQFSQQNPPPSPQTSQQPQSQTPDRSAVDKNQVRQKFLQAQKQARSEMNPNAQSPSKQITQSTQAPQQAAPSQQNHANQTQPLNHNDPNVPDYLQNVANRDYSELVERFGD